MQSSESKLASVRGELQSRDLQVEALESGLAALQEVLVSRDLEVEALRSELTKVEGVGASLLAQLSTAKGIRNWAWACGYKEGLDRLKDHLLENPQTILRMLNLMCL